MHTQPQRSRLHRRRLLGVLLLGCGSALAACGGSGSPATTSIQIVAPASTTSAAQTAPAPTTTTAKNAAAPQTPTATTAQERARRARAIRGRNQLLKRLAPAAPPSPALVARTKVVLACLSGAGLGPVSRASTNAWTGYVKNSGGTFVYVQMYPTTAGAAAEARRLKPEDVAPAGRYLVHEAIAPYSGSPVPAVAACLGGKTAPAPGKAKKKKHGFSF